MRPLALLASLALAMALATGAATTVLPFALMAFVLVGIRAIGRAL